MLPPLTLRMLNAKRSLEKTRIVATFCDGLEDDARSSVGEGASGAVGAEGNTSESGAGRVSLVVPAGDDGQPIRRKSSQGDSCLAKVADHGALPGKVGRPLLPSAVGASMPFHVRQLLVEPLILRKEAKLPGIQPFRAVQTYGFRVGAPARAGRGQAAVQFEHQAKREIVERRMAIMTRINRHNYQGVPQVERHIFFGDMPHSGDEGGSIDGPDTEMPTSSGEDGHDPAMVSGSAAMWNLGDESELTADSHA